MIISVSNDFWSALTPELLIATLVPKAIAQVSRKSSLKIAIVTADRTTYEWQDTYRLDRMG
jgi:hypothetical protein